MTDGPVAPVSSTAALADGYVERVRFSWERSLREDLREADDGSAKWSLVEDYGSKDLIPLTPGLAPRPHRVAKEVARILGVTTPFDLLQTRHYGHVNAQALCDRTPVAVGLIGPVINLMNDAELGAVIGHELGHIVAHRAGSVGVHVGAAHRIRPRAPLVAARCSVAAELTADRFALLAAQDIDAAVGVEIASATGLDPRALESDLGAALAACVERVERGEGEIAGDTHPSADFRLFASWLFWRSDVFRELTGKGTGELALADVDAQLKQRLLEAPLVRRAPPEVVVKKYVVPSAPGFELKTKVEAFSVVHEVDIPEIAPSPWAVRAAEIWAEAREKRRANAPPGEPERAPSASSTAAAAPRPLRPSFDLPTVDDDLEQRFQALERAAAKAATTAPKPNDPMADLEARFLELEARFKEG